MTKIGVGVGEDFPMEDRPPPCGGADAQYSGAGGTWGADDWYVWRSARRAARAQWRAARAQYRAERRARRAQYWAEQARSGTYSCDGPYTLDGGYGYGGRAHFPLGAILLAGLAVLLPFLVAGLVLSALLSGLFAVVSSAPVLVFGLIIAAILWAAHRYHHRPAYYRQPPPPRQP